MANWLAGVALGAGMIALAATADAATVDVIGGSTTVNLDTDVLALGGLSISGVLPSDIAGPSGVAFPINGPDVSFPGAPSSASFDPDDISGTFSGNIEHTGAVFFNGNTLAVGSLSIQPTATFGTFTVVDTLATGLELFTATATDLEFDGANNLLTVSGNLTITQAFADVLSTFPGVVLPDDDLVAGSFTTEAIVTPLPGALVFAGTALAGLGVMRRVQQRRKQTH